MKTAMIVITGLLLFSTIVCGLWIRKSREKVAHSSYTFHMGSGLLTAVAVIIDMTLFM